MGHGGYGVRRYRRSIRARARRRQRRDQDEASNVRDFGDRLNQGFRTKSVRTMKVRRASGLDQARRVDNGVDTL
jgi:hypothetical protein